MAYDSRFRGVDDEVTDFPYDEEHTTMESEMREYDLDDYEEVLAPQPVVDAPGSAGTDGASEPGRSVESTPLGQTAETRKPARRRRAPAKVPSEPVVAKKAAADKSAPEVASRAAVTAVVKAAVKARKAAPKASTPIAAKSATKFADKAIGEK